MTQILANMERWRWLPRSFPARRVEVRLAQYELRYFDGVTSAPMLYDVIVGAPRTPSPVFAATIGSVTLNPDWNTPMSIVNSELLPRFRRDPSRVTREGYQVLDANGSAVDPAVVDWQARPFPYHLRQVPGAQNALGQLRFDLPNPFSVYLHDTPSQSLFERTTRALSHGCIRVKTPIALAASLLGDPWTESAINDAIAQGATQTIRLSQPTPVYLLYLTAVLGEDESVLYLDDINRRDAALAARLNGTNRQVVATASTAPATCAP
jgi:murein L,D-transpeptidase YcbB/YkuD